MEVSLDRQSAEALDAFEARAVADAEVQQCWRVSPGRTLCWWCTRAICQATWRCREAVYRRCDVRNVKAFFSTKRAKFETKAAASALTHKRQQLSFQ